MHKYPLSLTVFLFVGLLTYAAIAERVTHPERAAAALAEAAIHDFQNSLRKELLSVMAQAGPKAAIHVCSTKAPEIASGFSDKDGLSIKRTSLRWRNPDNAPTADEKAVMEEFEDRKNRGEKIQEISYLAAHDSSFVYMQAIPMQGMCMACHGANISPSIRQEIKILYPEDRAYGFKEGDIRGAFSVSIDKARLERESEEKKQ